MICSAIEFGASGTIEFYANNTVLARHTFMMTNTFPVNVPAEPEIRGLYFKIENVFVSNGKFNFVNFSLTANLQDFMQFRTQHITCGVEFLRSNSVRVGSYHIVGKSLNAVKRLSTSHVLISPVLLASELD